MNTWTRYDMPDAHTLWWTRQHRRWSPNLAASITDVVVEHLNEHCPKPNGSVAVMLEDVHRAQLERDRLRRAHDVVEAERDQARRERDKWEEKYLDTDEALHRTRRERDEWKQSSDEWQEVQKEAANLFEEAVDRVHAVEDERDEWKDRAEKNRNISSRRREHEELIDEIAETLYGPPPINGWHSIASLAADVRELAANAPVKGAAPEVTRADIKKAMADAAPGLVPHGACVDAVHALVSGSDPAVYVVRESDIAAVEVTEAGQFWRAGDTSIPLPWKANKVREKRDECAAEWVELEAISRAIEQDAATDPLLDKAREYLTVMFDYEEPDSASPAEWKAAIQMARHVIGQEAKR